jgi:hypothetical protein
MANPMRRMVAESIVKRSGRMTLSSLKEMLDIKAPKHERRDISERGRPKRKVPLTEDEVRKIITSSEHLVFDADSPDDVVYVENRSDRELYSTRRYWDD